MKNILLIIFIAISPFSFSQKVDCDDYFKKEKKSKKESMFADSRFIQTKLFLLWSDAGGNRRIYVQFKKTDTSYIVFRQQTMVTLRMKLPIILGQSIKIGIKFNDGKKYIVTFNGNENKIAESESMRMYISSNEKIIDSELAYLLKNNVIQSIEILNPIGRPDQGTVISDDANYKDSKKINEAFNCFLTR